jgi:hypothetical protein
MNNWQTEGYMVLAMKKAGVTVEQIKATFAEIRWLFNELTPNEDDEAGRRVLAEIEHGK